MGERIEIIYELNNLKGTCYVEIKPGEYSGVNWGEESIFFTDKTFTYFSKAIEKHYKEYSLWGISEINRETWNLVLKELEELKIFLSNSPNPEDLRKHIEYLYLGITEKYILENLNKNLDDLVKVITEFQSWINEKSKDNE
ncbi:hypothetical protein [Peribacillus deserti]|uniref:Uncharacterized protein n=1 Tax=Peribacillus deserti TaxID=673318 RepID=A0A2N5M1D6_9BACI|nr:hypothetical protein [Peribacillus deserti]PLT28177.1 hypothetical protein CUU66_19740 [Peribacillus deserti]